MRNRRRCGPHRRRGGRELSDTDVDVLRPALEAAVELARVAERSGAGSAPPALKKFVGFATLPRPALKTVMKALDGDAELRAGVDGLLSDDELSPGARAWLTRPQGWEEIFTAEVDRYRAERDEKESRRSARRERKRVEAAEAARARAEAALEDLRSEMDTAAGDLAAERGRRRDAETRIAQLAERVDDLAADLDRAKKDLGEARDLAERRLGDRRRVEEDLEALRSELETAQATQPEHAPAPAPPVTAGEQSPRPSWPGPGEVAPAVADAAAGARRLADALEALVRALAPPAPDDGAPSPAPPGPRERRRPIPVPGGLLEDSDEALAHFLAVPGVTVLVDGYNVAMLGWPDRSLAHQRDRLVSGLETLAAATGARFDVVFDGDGTVVAGTAGRSMGVHVRFSPADVEADDVVIATVGELPADRPVVVVSNDRRVRDGARSAGATVVSSDGLLRRLGRQV